MIKLKLKQFSQKGPAKHVFIKTQYNYRLSLIKKKTPVACNLSIIFCSVVIIKLFSLVKQPWNILVPNENVQWNILLQEASIMTRRLYIPTHWSVRQK